MRPPQMYCPECCKIVECSVAQGTAQDEYLAQREKQPRKQWKAYADIQGYQRLRVCREEFHEFHTVEIDKDFIDELVELRKLVETLAPQMRRLLKEAGKIKKKQVRPNQSE